MLYIYENQKVMGKKRIYGSGFLFVLIILIAFVIINNLIFYPKNILSWDVFGYYLYLPFQFIYNDLGITNDSVLLSIVEKYKNSVTLYQLISLPEGYNIIKCTMGLAILYMPFFLIGHIIAIAGNFPVDGFSEPYQYSIFAGSIIYTILGLIFLSKVLLNFFKEKVVAFVLIIIVFATNFIVHITMYGQNAMSHNYLFFLYSLILWLTVLWHRTNKFRYSMILALACGIAILSRPSEVVCLLIPLLWGVKDKKSLTEKLNLLLKYKWQMIVFFFVMLLIGSLQFLYWKIYAGKFLYNSYGATNAGEGMDFFNPYIYNVLFSFRKGWLIYTPVMIFAIIGLYSLYKNNKSIFFSVLAYFILNIYLVSCWSCWWYAQSFGQRAIIPSYVIMALPLGYFIEMINNKKKFIKNIIYSVLFILLLLNIFQTRQFHNGIIHPDRMTMKYYFRVFGKMYVTEEDKKYLLIDRSFDGKESFNDPENYNLKFVKTIDFEDYERKDTTVAYSGKYSCLLDSNNIYSPAIELPYYDLTIKDHVWIRASVYFYLPSDSLVPAFSLITHFVHNDYPYKYNGFDSENVTIAHGNWNKVSFDYLTPEVRNKTDKLKVYVWLRGKTPLYIDELQIEVYERKN